MTNESALNPIKKGHLPITKGLTIEAGRLNQIKLKAKNELLLQLGPAGEDEDESIDIRDEDWGLLDDMAEAIIDETFRPLFNNDDICEALISLAVNELIAKDVVAWDSPLQLATASYEKTAEALKGHSRIKSFCKKALKL